MLAALLVFHGLLLRQFIEAFVFRRFDLVGGPRKWYQFRIDDNVSGMFGRQQTFPCSGEANDDAIKACKEANPISLHMLKDDPDYAQYKTFEKATGRCG